MEKVSKPSDWVNAMVMVEKKHGSVCLCIDPVDPKQSNPTTSLPNPHVQRRNRGLTWHINHKQAWRPIGLLDTATNQMVIWSLVIYTMFSTVFRRYRRKRYPFGLVSAQDEFQHQMEEIFKGLEGIHIIINDILEYGKGEEEHNNRSLCSP